MRLPSLPSVSWTQLAMGAASVAVVGWLASGFFSGSTPDATQPPRAQQQAMPGDRVPSRPVPQEASGAPASTEAAGATIEPAETRTGDVGFALTLAEVRHMYDAAVLNGNPAGGSAQSAQGGSKPPPGSALLSTARKATHNIDPSQKPPTDPKGQGEMIRHFVLRVQRASTNESVPYLEVSLDLLRDGRPVLYDQPLLPMVATGEDATKLYYGNNVAFPGKGVYQVFVRLRPNPFLGTDAPPAAQFNITFK